MADIDNTVGYSSQPVYAGPLGFLYERIIDFSVAVNNMVATDTMQLFDLPAGLLVMGAKVETLTVQGAACTADLGLTGGNVDEYIDGADLNAAAVVMSGDAVTPEPIALQNNGKYLSAAETVSLLANNTLNAAVVRFQIFGYDLRSRLPDPAA